MPREGCSAATHARRSAPRRPCAWPPHAHGQRRRARPAQRPSGAGVPARPAAPVRSTGKGLRWQGAGLPCRWTKCRAPRWQCSPGNIGDVWHELACSARTRAAFSWRVPPRPLSRPLRSFVGPMNENERQEILQRRARATEM
eukprot:scaffold113190_cov48-Phaeocystis_antarctica.AAC.2